MKRFWDKVRKGAPDECWEWQAARRPDGYGAFRLDGRMQLAHRVSYELEHGVGSAAGTNVNHSCDNPPCVNPNHLWLGSQAAGMADRDAKGRAHAKLTAEQVLEIRALSDLQRVLAEKYGVTQAHISRIRNHGRRKHIPDKET